MIGVVSPNRASGMDPTRSATDPMMIAGAGPRVETIRDAYAARLRAQQEGLGAIAAAAGFSFGVHRTDHAPEAALLALYMALARQ